MTEAGPDPLDVLLNGLKRLRRGPGIAGDPTRLREVPRALWQALGAPATDEAASLHYLLKLVDGEVDAMNEPQRSLLVIALNTKGTSRRDWTARLQDLGRQLGSDKTARRRVDSALERLAVRLLSPTLLSPDGNSASRSRLSFSEFPARVVAHGLDKVHVVVGSTDRERHEGAHAFAATELDADVLGELVHIRRQSVSGSIRDLVRIGDLCAVLARAASSVDVAALGGTGMCVADVSVEESMLTDDLILVGGADTNVFIALFSVAHEKAFGTRPPVRYSGDSSRYFTCDEFISELSGSRYRRLEESGSMHCGYVLFCRNPWNDDRTVTVVSGIRSTGTQAALLALIRRTDQLYRTGESTDSWRRLDTNNRFHPSTAAKVIRASSARIVDSVRVVAPATTKPVPARARIPQRFTIEDFIFEE